MTVLKFPDRIGEVQARRLRRRQRHGVSIAKSALTLWLMPWLFWLSLIDALDEEEDA